jgi:hypothetical protein
VISRITEIKLPTLLDIVGKLSYSEKKHGKKREIDDWVQESDIGQY